MSALLSPSSEAKLKEAVITSLNISEKDYRADLALGEIEAWDSLGHLSLTFAIESEFGVKFEMEMIPELRNLNEIRVALQAKGVA